MPASLASSPPIVSFSCCLFNITMAFVYVFFLLSFAIFFFHLPNNLLVEAADINGGFSVSIFHRDSPKSPLFNPTETLSDRVKKAIQHSNARVDHIGWKINLSSISPATIRSNVIPNGGDYLMTLSIGTPAVNILSVVDTGSDLIWTQCLPCDQCFDQKDTFFDPSKSSTYQNVSCHSNLCSELHQEPCGGSGECQYSYRYGDQSYTNGDLATETLTFDSTSGSSVKLPKIAIGCGHNNEGNFNGRTDGIVGLGGGPLSLVRQLDSSINGKFSYCLLPLDDNTASSQLNFGDSAIISGNGVVSTPLIFKDPDTFYYLTLEKIVVGGKTVHVSSGESGNIIIDSGTTLTFLDTNTYNSVASILEDVIDLPPTEDPTGQLDVCFELSGGAKFPDMTFGFTNAELVLRPLNIFVQTSNNVVCLAMASSDRVTIFGNLAQQNFEVGYDLRKKTVSFAPTDCTKH